MKVVGLLSVPDASSTMLAPMATVMLATIRGLLLDLHVTSDHELNAALGAFLDLLCQPVA
jgi:hypothetical protein